MSPQAKTEKLLREGKAVTVLSILRKCGSTEDRRIISRLKRYMVIDDAWTEHRGKRFKTWRLGL